MLSFGFCSAKDEALPCRENNPHHIQNKSLKDIDDATRFIEFEAH